MALDIQNTTKAKLLEVYNDIKNNPHEFADTNIHTHVGSILNKFFGGINDLTVNDKKAKSKGKYQTFKPTAADFKKKSTNPSPVVANDPLTELSLAELKVKAKNLDIKYSNKTRDELIRDINWHGKEELDAKRQARITAKELDVNAAVEVDENEENIEFEDDEDENEDKTT